MVKSKGRQSFTVVIPTYSGEEYLPMCFDSILSQRPKPKFDVVVVIDGPNQNIKDITKAYSEKFKTAGIDFKVHQFAANQGRFRARTKGAELAAESQLLFIDDRVTFDTDYFSNILSEKTDLLIPNVQEAAAKNSVNRCLYLLRRRIYGKDKFGASFKSFYINKDNFEKSPKGTTSLWVGKKDFIDACSSLSNSTNDSRHTNDDTKIFRYFIDQGTNILKSSKAVIYYNPRSSAWKEIVHIYERGPRFVDYYMRPGTRFFWPLITMSAAIVVAVIVCILNPMLALWLAGLLLIADIVGTSLLSERTSDTVLIMAYPMIIVSFTLGVVVGIFNKLKSFATRTSA